MVNRYKVISSGWSFLNEWDCFKFSVSKTIKLAGLGLHSAYNNYKYKGPVKIVEGDDLSGLSILEFEYDGNGEKNDEYFKGTVTKCMF